eukprot:PhM_4_TR1424/c0_g2_i1/m.66698
MNAVTALQPELVIAVYVGHLASCSCEFTRPWRNALFSNRLILLSHAVRVVLSLIMIFSSLSMMALPMTSSTFLDVPLTECCLNITVVAIWLCVFDCFMALHTVSFPRETTERNIITLWRLPDIRLDGVGMVMALHYALCSVLLGAIGAYGNEISARSRPMCRVVRIHAAWSGVQHLVGALHHLRGVRAFHFGGASVAPSSGRLRHRGSIVEDGDSSPWHMHSAASSTVRTTADHAYQYGLRVHIAHLAVELVGWDEAEQGPRLWAALLLTFFVTMEVVWHGVAALWVKNRK